MVPVMMKAQMTPTWDDLQNRRSRWLTVMARLKDGVSREQAEAAMNVVYRQINEQEMKEIKTPSRVVPATASSRSICSCVRARRVAPICALSSRRRSSC